MNFEQIRQQYPQYNDLSDFEFATKFHNKFYSDLPMDEFASKIGYKTSQLAAGGKAAVESTLPSAAGLASAINLGRGGAMLGGAVAGAPGAVIGGIGGGLLGGFGGGAAAQKLQEKAAEYIPESVKETLGFGKEQRILETQQNPYTSFAGALAPNLAFFRPGAIEPLIDKAGKTILSPMAQRGLMAGAGGGLEAGQELMTEGSIDPAKVAMASAFQGIAATPTRLGRKFASFAEEPTPTSTARDPYFETVVEKESTATGARGKLPYFPENKEPILVGKEGEAVPMSQADNLEVFKQHAEEQRLAALEEERKQAQEQYGAELAAIDETMMQHPENLQAPQYGLGGKIAKHVDQEGRVKGKFEPGERTDQIEMDLNRQRVLQEEQAPQIEQSNTFVAKNGEVFSIESRPQIEGNPAAGNIFVALDKNGNKIGEIEDFSGGKYTAENPAYPGMMGVEDKWIGQGVGSALYSKARESAGGHLIPSSNVSSDAIRYWMRNDPQALLYRLNERADAHLSRPGGYTKNELVDMAKQDIREGDAFGKLLGEATLAKLEGKEYLPEWAKKENKPYTPPQGPKTLAAKQLTLKEATANLFDSLAEFTGAKMNFLPGEGLGKSVVEFVRALGREGYTTYQKAVAAAKNALGKSWENIKQFFKQAWDHVRNTSEKLPEGPTPFERYAENIRKSYPEATDLQIQKAWDLKNSASAERIKAQSITVNTLKTAAELSHQAQRTGDVWTPDEAIDILSTVNDLTKRSVFKEKMTSSGRIQRDLLDHPATTWVYNLVTKAIEDASRYARHVLDDFGVGVIPKIRQHSLTFKGAAEMKEYIRWRFENEGNASAKLPENFSQKVKEIHEALNKADADLIERMNRVLARDGKAPITALDNHMVHYWSGPYRAYVYVKTAQGGSRLAFFVSEKSMAEAEKALAWIRKNIPNVDQEKSTGIKFVKSDVRTRSSMFDHLLDLSNEKDPAVLEALQAFKDRISSSQETHLNEQMRQKTRAGVEGFLGNKPWKTEAQNYADALESIRRKYDAGYQWIAAQEIRQQMAPVLQAQQDGKLSVGNALALGQQYADHALGKNQDSNPLVKLADWFEDMSPNVFGTTRRGFNVLHGALNKITLPYILALKGTQAVQAVAQPFQSVLPRMLENAALDGGGFKTYGNIPVAFGQGLADGLFQLMHIISAGKTSGLQTELYKLAGFKDSIAIVKAMQDLDVTRMSLADVGFGREGGTLKTLGNVTSDLVFNGSMNLFEAPTRAWSFSAYARQALMNGHDMPTALKMAREAMDTVVNYNPEATAQGLSHLGPLGGEARGLHTFMINYYSQLARYIQVAAKSKNPAPLLAYLGMTFALGGAMGFIGVDAADWLLDNIKSAMQGTKHDSPALQKFNVRQWLMENAPESISAGPLSTMSGLGLYGSFTTKVVDPSRTFLENIFPKTFATIQLGKGFLEAPKLLDPALTDKERGTILENLAPKAFTQRIRNAYQNVDGTVYESGAKQLGLPQYQRTPTEQKISEKGMGIRGLAEVMSTEERANYLKGQANVEESRKQQINKLDSMIVNAMKKGTINQFQQKAIMDKIQELKTTWQWEPEKMESHLLQLQQKFALPSDLVRRIAQIKTPTPSNVQKLQDLGSMYNRQVQRQQQYGK